MKSLIAALLLTTTPAMAFDLSAMTEAEKTAFGQAVREYLMANPEVLIESIQVLEQRQATQEAQNDVQLVAQYSDQIFNDDHSWVGGNPDGDLTIVEFIDYRCGVCRRVFEEVSDVVEDDGNIRFVLKEFPILGEQSELSSRFAIAVKQVAGDEAYSRAHDALMTMRGDATTESLTALADELQVDTASVMAAMSSEEVTQVLRENHELGQNMAIQGTPTFVIGDQLLRGVPASGLAAAVEAIRAQQPDQG